MKEVFKDVNTPLGPRPRRIIVVVVVVVVVVAVVVVVVVVAIVLMNSHCCSLPKEATYVAVFKHVITSGFTDIRLGLGPRGV